MYGKIDAQIVSDSSSAIALASKRGVGKIRHLETGALWIQSALANKRFSLSKVDGKKNVADILTKYVDKATLAKHLITL
eukprot:2384178-Karenia_brevis.AAC.1